MGVSVVTLFALACRAYTTAAPLPASSTKSKIGHAACRMVFAFAVFEVAVFAVFALAVDAVVTLMAGLPVS